MEHFSSRLTDLLASLEDFDVATTPSWQTGQIFNALLKQAKQQLPDDVVVQAIAPAAEMESPAGRSICDTDAGSMKAAVNQIITAVDGPRF